MYSGSLHEKYTSDTQYTQEANHGDVCFGPSISPTLNSIMGVASTSGQNYGMACCRWH